MLTIPTDYDATIYNGNGFPYIISEETLKNIIGELSNTTLPKDNTACWEILVGSQPIQKSATLPSENLYKKESNFPAPAERSLQYPVLFRIHHSLGDGVALMQLLISVLNDISSPSRLENTAPVKPPRLPPVPMPVRKFQYSNNSLSNILEIKNEHQIGKSTTNDRNEVNSPISRFGVEGSENSKGKEISINLETLEENRVSFHNDKYNESQIILRTAPSCPQMKTTSSNLQSIEENTVLFHNNKQNESEMLLRTAPSCPQMKTTVFSSML